MAEPFKNLFNLKLVEELGGHIARHEPGLDRDGFVHLASDGLEFLELKARSRQITAEWSEPRRTGF